MICDYSAFLDNPDHRWVYNKLDLYKRLGYDCGIGLDETHRDRVVIKPMVSMLGMSRGVEIAQNRAQDIPNGYFWCEYFTGPHVSVDYVDGEVDFIAIGQKKPGCLRFTHWKKLYVTEFPAKIPDFIESIIDQTRFVNIEYIGNKIIEVHLRRNPDFMGHDYTKLRVVYDKSQKPKNKEQFIHSVDGDRLGFFAS